MKKCANLFFVVCFVIVLINSYPGGVATSGNSYHTLRAQCVANKIFLDDSQSDQDEDFNRAYAKFSQDPATLQRFTLRKTDIVVFAKPTFRYQDQSIYLLFRNIRI